MRKARKVFVYVHASKRPWSLCSKAAFLRIIKDLFIFGRRKLQHNGRQLKKRLMIIPLQRNFGNCATPVKTKLLSVNFELGPWQIFWKFSDLYRSFVTKCAEAIHYKT